MIDNYIRKIGPKYPKKDSYLCLTSKFEDIERKTLAEKGDTDGISVKT
jgi:hypothetical protein